MYDLPQELQDTRSTETGPVPQMTVDQHSLQPGSLGNVLNPVTAPLPPTQPQTFTDDWSFLKDFGDSTDQFFSWDVELRDLLDSGFALEGQGYA